MVREGLSGDLQSFTDTGQSYFSFILIIDTIQMKIERELIQKFVLDQGVAIIIIEMNQN